MNLDKETVEAYKCLLMNPKENGLMFTPMTDYFVKSNTVTAKHILAESYIKYIDKPLPKIILYIIMDEIYGQCVDTDSNKDLGYYLKINQ